MSVDLESIDMVSGVNEKGEGFITVACHGRGGEILLGQMSPEQVREHALALIGAAEAAEQDAALYRVFERLELPQQVAGMVITELRNSREE